MKQRPRLPRIERSEEVHVEDETTHLWAISYADFLMVLLSFFILFFSNDDKNEVIEKIIGATKHKQDAGGKGGASSAGVADRDPASKTVLPEDIISHVNSKFDVQVDENDKRVIFMFPNDIYGDGQTTLGKEHRKQLKSLLDTLKPFAESIEIEFVGHTDSQPLVHSANTIVNDNFALSVIRATRALQYAQSIGYPANTMAAKGSADRKRDSKTLSIIIRAAREEI